MLMLMLMLLFLPGEPKRRQNCEDMELMPWFSEDEFENKTRQRVYAISGMGCNMVLIFF